MTTLEAILSIAILILTMVVYVMHLIIRGKKQELENETRWAAHYAARAELLRDSINEFLEYMDKPVTSRDEVGQRLAKLAKIARKQP